MSKKYYESMRDKGHRMWKVKGLMHMYTAAAYISNLDAMKRLRENFGAKIETVIIGREMYAAGNTSTEAHFHVFVQWKEPKELRWGALDAIFEDLGYYKPVTQTPERAIAYCCKDGDVISWSEDMPQLAVRINAARQEWHKEAIETRMFINAITSHDPKVWAKEFALADQMQKSLAAETPSKWLPKRDQSPERN